MHDAFSISFSLMAKLVAVGLRQKPGYLYDFAAVAILANGTIDTTFGVAEKVRTDFGHADFDRRVPLSCSLTEKSSQRDSHME